MGTQGTSSSANSTTNTHSLKYETMHDERKISELFHITVISNLTNIDTLFDSGSQANLISEKIVKTLGL
jgi:hypothetical protein